VRYLNWTADGLLRHATYLGLREDKPAREIVHDQRYPRGRQTNVPAFVEKA
jgi:bifunctional non-homologous end joining protein LigD